MIEALERYAEKYDIKDKTNFYLAKDGMIKSDDNNQILSKVFETLSLKISASGEAGRCPLSLSSFLTILSKL
jgi:hypothetical protein